MNTHNNFHNKAIDLLKVGLHTKKIWCIQLPIQPLVTMFTSYLFYKSVQR